MVAYSSKNKKPRSSLKIFTAVFLMGMVVLFIFLNFRVYNKQLKVEEHIDSLKAEIKRLQSKKGEYVEDISQAKKKGFMEDVAREELNFKKPGEKVVVLQLPEKLKNKEEEKQKQKEKSFFDRLWEKITGKEITN